jgi:hypothetical protein
MDRRGTTTKLQRKLTRASAPSHAVAATAHAANAVIGPRRKFIDAF